MSRGQAILAILATSTVLIPAAIGVAFSHPETCRPSAAVVCPTR